MICNMGTGGKKCRMEVHLKGNSREDARMAMDCTDGLIRRCTKASGSKARSTGVALMSGPTEDAMTVSGARTSSTVKVSTSGPMAVSILEVT